MLAVAVAALAACGERTPAPGAASDPSRPVGSPPSSGAPAPPSGPGAFEGRVVVRWDVAVRGPRHRPVVALRGVRRRDVRLSRTFAAGAGDRVLLRRRLGLGEYLLRASARGGAVRPCSATVRADPGFTTTATVRAELRAGRCVVRVTSPLDAYVGLTLAEAEARARRGGRTVREVERDGEPLAVTQDLSSMRINVATRDGWVVRVDGVF